MTARQWAQRYVGSHDSHMMHEDEATGLACLVIMTLLPTPSLCRLHYVIQCYQEILLYMQHMSTSHDETLKESTKVREHLHFLVAELASTASPH